MEVATAAWLAGGWLLKYKSGLTTFIYHFGAYGNEGSEDLKRI